ncbi:MAG TPA: dihydroneopterin aldolase, partial [Niabella sp.]|nr:dihydroneopterin aldolase [Niabella sp.]
LGNQFELNISISFPSDRQVIDQLDDTINYATVYELVKNEMQHPRELLETLLSQLAQNLKTTFPQITHIKLSIFKLQMPLNHFVGKMGVEIEKQY